MRRALKFIGSLLLLLLLAGAGAVALAFARMPEIPDGRELGGGARVVKDGYVSAFIVEAGPKAVVLIDAGNDPEGKALTAELGRRGLGMDAVKAIFLTHGHPDHTAACALFPQAQVMALAAEVPVAEGRARSKGPLTRHFPPKDLHMRVTRPLQDGEVVQVGSLSVQVFAVPGHTAGSAAYLAAGTLYLGDSADATKEGKVTPALWVVTDDPEQNRASLQALARRLAPRAREVKTLAFGHTGVLVGAEPLLELAAAR